MKKQLDASFPMFIRTASGPESGVRVRPNDLLFSAGNPTDGPARKPPGVGSSSHHSRLDQFQILQLLGSGAFGKVYLARHRPTGNFFAIKSMKKEALIRSGGHAQARVERDILALLMDRGYEKGAETVESQGSGAACAVERASAHPFIVRLHCAFQTSSRVFLVMDYLRGGPLMEHLRKEALFSEEVARFYAAEMLIALQHLHSMGIVHRDLKPENVLLDHEGHVALTDFGLSKAGMGRLETDAPASFTCPMVETRPNCQRESLASKGFDEYSNVNGAASVEQTRLSEKDSSEIDAAQCLTHSWCGTEHYMAPELLAREGHSFAADYWSYGCLIYEMLTGEPPFSVKAQGLCGKRRRRRPRIVGAIPAVMHPEVTSGNPKEKGTPENVFSREALYKRIMRAKVKFPHYLSTEAQSLVRQLLCRSPDERLGNALRLRHHRWFRGISWRRVRERLERPPLIPATEEIPVESTTSCSTPVRDASLNISPHTSPGIQTSPRPETYLVAFTYVAPHALHAFGDYLDARNSSLRTGPCHFESQNVLSSSASSVSERSSLRAYTRNRDSDSEHTGRDVVDALEEMRIAVSEGVEIFSIDGAGCGRSED